MAKMANIRNPAAEVEEALTRMTEAEERLSEATSNREVIHDNLTRLAAEWSHREGHAASLEREIGELEARLRELEAQLEQRQEKAAGAARSVEEARDAVLGLDRDSFTVKKLRELVRALDRSRQALAEAEQLVRETKAEIGFVEERLRALRDLLEGERRDADSLRAKKDEAAAEEQAADEAVREAAEALNESHASLGEAFKAFKGNGAASISREVLELIRRSARAERQDFLSLRFPTDGLDELALRALEQLRAELSPEDKVKSARDEFVRLGIASDVAKVTKRLRRTRMPRVRRALLERSYVPLLVERLGGGAIDPQIASDTVGLADAILADLDADGGPADRFAELLADAAVEAMALNALPGTPARTLVVEQIRASF